MEQDKSFSHKTNVKLKSTQSKKRDDLFFYLVIVILPMLQFCVFYIATNFNSIRLAFCDYSIKEKSYVFVGFDTFKSVWNDLVLDGSVLLISIKNSVIFFASSLLIGNTLALFFSYYVYKEKFCYKIFRVALFIPSIISSIVLVMLFSFFMDNAVPQTVYALTGNRIEGLIANLDTRMLFIIIFNIYISFGPTTLIYASSMSKIDESIVEAAKLDGVSAFREFFTITLPLIFSTFTTFVVVALAALFNNQANLYSFFGQSADYSIYTVGYYIFVKINSGEVTLSDYSYLSAVGLIFTVVAIPLTFFVKSLLEKIDPAKDI